MKNILIAIDTSEKQRERILSIANNCKIKFEGNCTEEDVINADAIFGNVLPEMIKKNTKIEWLQTASAGVDPYIKSGILREGCKLTNATGAYGFAISEHMLAMHLSLIKKLPIYRDYQNNSEWKDAGTVTSIRDSTVLIVGMGDIGSEYAKLCKAMGAYVVGVRRTDLSCPNYADEMHLIADLDDLLPSADVVAISLPGTPATANMFNAARLAKMKDGAIILNVGRGSVVNTDDLCCALESGKLAGAGLDVVDPEPLQSDSRIWKNKTALITPHVSGGYHLEKTRELIFGIFEYNLARFLKGEDLKNNIDFSTGYRRRGN